MRLMCKRGGLVLQRVSYVLVNLVFFFILLLFVFKSATGAAVYEQAYAKQVALLIDEAEPDILILIDFEKGIEVAEGNKKTSGLIKQDKEENKVIVNLGGKGGYGYKYFSNYEVTFYEDIQEKVIVVKVGDKVFDLEGNDD